MEAERDALVVIQQVRSGYFRGCQVSASYNLPALTSKALSSSYYEWEGWLCQPEFHLFAVKKCANDVCRNILVL